MFRYNYKYIITWVGAMGILAVLFYLFFPVKSLGYLIFFLFTIVVVLWRYLNFININEDTLVLTSFLKKRRFEFRDIRKIVLAKDNSLHKGTLRITVYGENKSCTLLFGNLKYDQAKHIKRMIGNKTNVVII